MTNEWKEVQELASELALQGIGQPDVFVVLGSGLGGIVDSLRDRVTIDTKQLRGWPPSTVAGHAGALHFGVLGQQRVLMQQGRAHLYEGNSPAQVTRPVRAAIALGAGTVLLTNAAGGVRPSLRPGQLLLLRDHLNLTGNSPLVGPNDDRHGPRFPDMSEVYDATLRRRFLEAAAGLGIDLAQGVYAGLLGPSYETPAEVRMLAVLGADAVGMSTVLEAIAARHMGCAVAAVSCITNMAAGLPGSILDHEDVQRTGAAAGQALAKLIVATLSDFAKETA